MINTVNNKGYEPFWDFLKGSCIICVILHHCLQNQVKDVLLFCFWGETAVPLFIILQCYHYFRKTHFVWNDYLLKMWNRVIRPFLIVETILLSSHLLLDCYILNNTDFFHLLKQFVARGGLGWGAYYPWIYVEIALLLPLLNYLLCRIPNNYLVLFFIFISIALELICCVTDVKESVYRLLFFRYFFLIYCGLRLCKNGFKMGKKEWLMSVISIFFIVLFEYSEYDFWPFFYTQSVEWKIAHWVCYFYVVHLLLFLIRKFYLWSQSFLFIYKNLVQIGKSSYEIFLLQMCYFSFLPPYIFKFNNYPYFCCFFYYLFSLCFCVIPVVCINRRKNVFKHG